MQEQLKEIKNVQSVMGSYVHISGSHEIHSDLPKIFLSKVKEIGEVFDRVLKVNQATNMHASTIEFKFDEAMIFLRPIDQDACLITFCETDINKKMLNMTTGMLVNDLKAAVELVRRGGKMPAPAPAKPPQAAVSKPKEELPIGKTVDVNKIIHAGPLAKVFQGFQDSLALAIGPISEMVIKDTVEIWAQNGECSQARLPELVEMLVKEIDDPSLEAEFKLAVKKYLI
jgi:hypothetical protein